MKHLRSKGYAPKDLSENEVAILHGKHMVGGRAPKAISDKGEYLFSKTGEFISNNTDNPPDGSYSFSLDRIDPIEDAPDVLPSHQNFDHYGYATTISKDGSTLVVRQGRMYGCEQSSNNQT